MTNTLRLFTCYEMAFLFHSASMIMITIVKFQRFSVNFIPIGQIRLCVDENQYIYLLDLDLRCARIFSGIKDSCLQIIVGSFFFYIHCYKFLIIFTHYIFCCISRLVVGILLSLQHGYLVILPHKSLDLFLIMH